MKFNEYEIRSINDFCRNFAKDNGFRSFSGVTRKSANNFSCTFFNENGSFYKEFYKNERGEWFLDSDYLDDSSLTYRQ